jgi:hypothetical protein
MIRYVVVALGGRPNIARADPRKLLFRFLVVSPPGTPSTKYAHDWRKISSRGTLLTVEELFVR